MSTVVRALLALALAAPLAAQFEQHDFQLFEGGVTGTVRSPWPMSLPRGYAPVFVELRNELERTVDVGLEAGDIYRGYYEVIGIANADVRLAPGERRELELLVPFHRSYARSPYLRATTDARETAMVQLMTGSASADVQDRMAAWITPTRLAPGTVERIAAELNVDDPFIAAVVPAGGVVASAVSGAPDWTVFEALPRSLPSRAAAWAAIDVVILDARAGDASLAGLALDPLASHVRQGGFVVVLGDRGALARVVGDVGLLDERLALPRFGKDGEAWHHGLGQVAWLPDSAGELVNPADRRALADVVGEAHSLPFHAGVLQPGTTAAHGENNFLAIPGVGQLPVHVFVLMLIVFAIVIGPVNLVVLRRLGRPALLIATIPAISLLASLGILAFGVLHQGLDLKGAVHSLTLLDQRDGRAMTVARLALMPGLAIDGLTPERGTTVHPTGVAASQERRFVIEHGDGLRFSGGWAPVRTMSNLLVSSDAPARSRVELARVTGGVELTNTLDTTIEGFLLVDSNGAWYAMAPATRLEPGGKVLLTPTAEPSTSGIAGISFVSSRFIDVRGSYFAAVQTNPFLDTLGQEPNFRDARHVIQGILPLDEARWGQ